jgi:hypothetical protein
MEVGVRRMSPLFWLSWRAAFIDQNARCDGYSVHSGGVVPHPVCTLAGWEHGNWTRPRWVNPGRPLGGASGSWWRGGCMGVGELAL